MITVFEEDVPQHVVRPVHVRQRRVSAEAFEAEAAVLAALHQ
ncbi:hypothetical protein [Streptomyces sp. NPDC005345]